MPSDKLLVALKHRCWVACMKHCADCCYRRATRHMRKAWLLVKAVVISLTNANLLCQSSQSCATLERPAFTWQSLHFSLRAERALLALIQCIESELYLLHYMMYSLDTAMNWKTLHSWDFVWKLTMLLCRLVISIRIEAHTVLEVLLGFGLLGLEPAMM